mgnify:CR=1 FL=1
MAKGGKNKLPAHIIKMEDLYKRAEKLFIKIFNQFEKLELGEIFVEEKKYYILQLKNNIKILRSLLLKIDITTIEPYVHKDDIKTLENNILYMLDTCDGIEKRLMAEEYIHDLYVPLKEYLEYIIRDSRNYKYWATSEKEFINKVISVLIHPDNIDKYKGPIKRIIARTMGEREFKRFFESIKHKILPLPNYNFKSFNDYKKEIE